jgi:glycosyltransferase involved in cell wall biosynthesis
MRITYVTEDTELWGGIAVIFQHLELLAGMGHEVFLTTLSGRPDWYPLSVPLRTIERLDASFIPPADIIVATSWRTIDPVVRSNQGIAVHLCQGYEAGNKEYRSIKDEIDEAYSLKIPKLVISPHMEKFLAERFGCETFYVGQMLNRDIFYPRRDPFKGTRDHFVILVVGIFEADVKNIEATLRGISAAKSKLHSPFRLIRVSPFPLTKAESKIMKPDVYHFRVPYFGMGDIYRSADVVISMSKEVEGFGLPALEAMGCGVPTILSKISSYTSFAEPPDYALFVDPSDSDALAVAISELLSRKSLRERLIRRGLNVADKFNKRKMIERLKATFENLYDRQIVQREK